MKLKSQPSQAGGWLAFLIAVVERDVHLATLQTLVARPRGQASPSVRADLRGKDYSLA